VRDTVIALLALLFIAASAGVVIWLTWLVFYPGGRP